MWLRSWPRSFLIFRSLKIFHNYTWSNWLLSNELFPCCTWLFQSITSLYFIASRSFSCKCSWSLLPLQKETSITTWIQCEKKMKTKWLVIVSNFDCPKWLGWSLRWWRISMKKHLTHWSQADSLSYESRNVSAVTKSYKCHGSEKKLRLSLQHTR